ncbi:TPA: glycosyltransferase family 4 protein [Vibrio vulnificus]|nr:glycosyltransferase family 4 protein [Vibrio vulnificus]
MKILVVSPHFPTPDIYKDISNDPRSKFLLTYIMEWELEGHQITVLHIPPKYPKLFSILIFLLGNFKGKLKSKYSRYIQHPDSVKENKLLFSHYTIFRIPLAKYIPHSEYSRFQLKRLAKRVRKYINNIEIEFDVVIFDYLSPSLRLLDFFDFSEKTKIYFIPHQTDVNYINNGLNRYKKSLMSVDGLLFRSSALKKIFSPLLGDSKETYSMYSGIPNSTVLANPKSKVSKFLYVGTLRKSKNIHNTIYAISNLRGQFPQIVFDIIGTGEYEEELRSLVVKLKLSDSVRFLGKLSHEKVLEVMKDYDSLVMVSKETFGMVYIEAMSQGLVVVAAAGEGIDGVVNSGINGYLVQLNDQVGLESCLSMLISDKCGIVKNVSSKALETASSMKNSMLAKNLINRISTTNGIN